MKNLVLALLCVSSPTLVQAADLPAKSVQLSKVILDTESRPIAGKLKGGTLCVFPSKIDGILPKNKKSEDYERYDVLFAERMKSAGFKVVTTSADLFASEDGKNKADFLVGAVVHPDTLNICSSVNGEKGNVTLSVDWQVFDRAAGKVVETATTSGQGVQEKFSRDGLVGMWNRAFVTGLEALVAQGTLQKHTGPVTPIDPPAPPPVVAPAVAVPAAKS